MLPRPPSASSGRAKACESRNGAVRLRAMTACQSSAASLRRRGAADHPGVVDEHADVAELGARPRHQLGGGLGVSADRSAWRPAQRTPRSAIAAVAASNGSTSMTATSAPASASASAIASPSPRAAPVTSAPRPRRENSSPLIGSSDVHVPRVDAGGLVVPPRALQPREHVVIAHRAALLVHVHERAVDLEQRQHLLAALGHDERVRLARRLEDEAALLGHPVVLEVVPAALEDVREHRPGVAVAGDDPRAGHPHQVRVLPGGDVEVQRARPHAVRQRDPQLLVARPDVRDHQVGPHVPWLRAQERLGSGVTSAHVGPDMPASVRRYARRMVRSRGRRRRPALSS